MFTKRLLLIVSLAALAACVDRLAAPDRLTSPADSARVQPR
jgi:hypothetical protein